MPNRSAMVLSYSTWVRRRMKPALGSSSGGGTVGLTAPVSFPPALPVPPPIAPPPVSVPTGAGATTPTVALGLTTGATPTPAVPAPGTTPPVPSVPTGNEGPMPGALPPGPMPDAHGSAPVPSSPEQPSCTNCASRMTAGHPKEDRCEAPVVVIDRPPDACLPRPLSRPPRGLECGYRFDAPDFAGRAVRL